MYQGACRFVRKEQEILIPMKVDIESDQPVVNQPLYQITSSMKLGDFEMGNLTVLLPASSFGLEQEEGPDHPPPPRKNRRNRKRNRRKRLRTAEEKRKEKTTPG